MNYSKKICIHEEVLELICDAVFEATYYKKVVPVLEKWAEEMAKRVEEQTINRCSTINIDKWGAMYDLGIEIPRIYSQRDYSEK